MMASARNATRSFRAARGPFSALSVLSIGGSLLGGLLFAGSAQAQFKVSSDFRSNTQPGWTITGTNNSGTNDSGILTGGYGAIPNNVNDANGSGWLRLTTNSNNQTGLALYTGGSFPSSQGVIVEFDYVNWGGNGADGTAFFLYDATQNMTGAQNGGSLGYCHGTGGYLGIGLDEFGNFSSSMPGVANGCPANSSSPGARADNLVVRGPLSDNNRWLSSAAITGGIDSPNVTARPANERLRVSLIPNGTGYLVSVALGLNGGTPTTLLNNLNFPYAAPANLRMGYAGSTGGLNNVHEIRNFIASVPANIGVTKTTPSARVTRGLQTTYQIVITNLDINPIAAGNQAPTIPGTDAPNITDNFPAQFINTSWTCAASAGSTCPSASGTGNISFAGGYTMAPGGTLTFTVTGTVAPNATCNANVANTVTVDFATTDGFGDIDPTNNTATANFAVDCINLAIDKTTPQASFTAGGTAPYSLAVSNTGTIPTTGQITLTDALPAGLLLPDGAVALTGANAAAWTCNSATNVVTCTSNTAIANGATSTFGFNANVDFNASGTVINTARVAGGGDANCPIATPCPDPTPPSTPIVRPTVNLSLTKSDANGSYTPGSTASYTLRACNTDGPDGVNGATVVDNLPRGVTLTGAWTCAGTGGGTCPASGGAAGGTTVNLAANLPVGGCVTVTVPVRFSANPADY